MASILRTISAADALPRSAYGVLMPAPALRWPMAQVGHDLDYSLDLTTILADVGDSVASIALAIAPAGADDLRAVDLTVDGGLVTAQLTGGVAGRDYRCRIVATGLSGRVLPYTVSMLIGPPPATPSAALSDPEYGPPITWSAGVTVFGAAFASVATGLAATGTDQASAVALAATTNVFTTVPAGAGARLPAAIVSGTIAVVNAAATDLLIYPPVGAQIGDAGANVAAIVSPGQRVHFSTQSPATQWFAA